MEEQAGKTEEENARIEKEVEKEVELRMKGKQQGSKLNPSIELENMGWGADTFQKNKRIYKINYVIRTYFMLIGP